MSEPDELDRLAERALTLDSESAEVDFKQAFTPAAGSSWCEIVKDIVAMANSGGGVLIIGLSDDGSPSPNDCSDAISVDPAVFDDKLKRYIGRHQLDPKLKTMEKGGKPLLAVLVRASRFPIVFINPGTYEDDSGRQKTAFSVGQVYFRHGAKSEPGTTEDIRACIDREVARVREEWLGNIRKVVEAPLGSVVMLAASADSAADAPAAVPARLVHADGAMPVAWRSPDETHPHRQKEVVSAINEKLGGAHRITSHDVQCARREFNADGDPNLVYKSKFGSVQYSDAFVSAVIDGYRSDSSFFTNIRERHRKRRSQRAV